MTRSQEEPLSNWVPQESDQRGEYRIVGRVSADLQVEAEDPEGPGPPRWLRCNTRDISANGLRVVTDEPITTGALLPVRVSIDQAPPFILTAEVPWCRQGRDGFWRVGLSLMESDDSTLTDWKDTIARLMG